MGARRVVTIPPLRLNLILFMKEVEAWGDTESNFVSVAIYYLKAVLVQRQRERKIDGRIALACADNKVPVGLLFHTGLWGEGGHIRWIQSCECYLYLTTERNRFQTFHSWQNARTNLHNGHIISRNRSKF